MRLAAPEDEGVRREGTQVFRPNRRRHDLEWSLQIRDDGNAGRERGVRAAGPR
jgi:hypothetical protein